MCIVTLTSTLISLTLEVAGIDSDRVFVKCQSLLSKARGRQPLLPAA